jgi:hypothetical protein
MKSRITDNGFLPFRHVAPYYGDVRKYACNICGYTTPWLQDGKELHVAALQHLKECVPPLLKEKG